MLVDLSAGNLNWPAMEVVDPDPQFIPLTPVPEPASVWHEAVTPGWQDPEVNDPTPGVVWRWTRRGAIRATGSAPIVFTADPEIPPATRRFPPAYARGQTVYAVSLVCAENEIQLVLAEGYHGISAAVHAVGAVLPLSQLGLALRAGDGTIRKWRLRDLDELDDEHPYDWAVTRLSAADITALPRPHRRCCVRRPHAPQHLVGHAGGAGDQRGLGRPPVHRHRGAAGCQLPT